MKRVIYCCIALVVQISGLAAQGRQVAFRTLCLQVADGLDAVSVRGKEPGQNVEVPLYTDLSPVVEGVFASNQAEFFIEETGADGKVVREIVAKAPLGKSTRQLFVFIPSGQKGPGKRPYRLMCYDDDEKAFGMGQIRAINLAPVPVRFVISGHTTPQIPSGKFAQFPHSTKVNDYNMYPVVVQFLGANGEWVKGQSVSWKATDRRREIVVTLVDPKFKQPVVRMYTDFPPWLEAPVEKP